MIAEAIAKILSLAAPTTFDIGDKTYASAELHEVKPELNLPPWLPLLTVHTLTGMADLISNNLDMQFGSAAVPSAARYAIHIENYNSVSVVRLDADTIEYGDKQSRRQLIIHAEPVEFTPFAFERWMSQEDFAISARAKFCDTPDLQDVLNLASTLTNEAILTSEDNGFTQKATAKAGLKQKENVTIKPVVSLAPFRIFPEVPQPISQFVLRAKVENEVPKLALFEADGGKWKNDAIKAIAQYLKGLGTELPIIA